MRFIIFLFLFFFSVTYGQNLPINLLTLPPGFKAEIYAWPVQSARQMAVGKKGTVFVGSTVGRVYAIVLNRKSQFGTRTYVIASGLNFPNGVAFSKGSLYVAETNRILRYDNIEDNLPRTRQPVVVVNNLPGNVQDGLRYIRFGPDGKLYIAIGMPCNACTLNDERFGTISRMNRDGSNFEIFVKGIRNSGGFDWDPITNFLWFSENGRVGMGDNFPPDKLNVAPVKGLDFGFPYFDGKNLPNPNFTPPRDAKFTFPTYELPPHVTPLGMSFYTGNMFPPEYQNHLFIAEHGSWTSSYKVGYQVSVAKIIHDQVLSDTSFLTGWLQGQQVWGSPVDIIVMQDGSLLISDDFAGIIYRVSYETKNL